jgi:hypothetical protein
MTRNMKLELVALFGVAVGVLLLSGRAFAHHGGAAYETTKSTTLKGTIVEFKFINPHCQLFIEVKDEKGDNVKWDGEFTNPGALHRRGWTKEMFKPGDPVTLTGNRAKYGAPVMRVLKVEFADGKTLPALGADDEN